ncbi:MAG: phage tail protein [Candidatus Spyradenecus sp.]
MAMIGIYGTFPFVCSQDQVRTFTDFSREHTMRWAAHEVIGRKPVLEMIGPDLTTASLKIRCDASLGVSPQWWIDKLVRQLNNGWHKKLIIGNQYFGQFVLEKVSVDAKYFDGKGRCLVAEATLTLKEWSE